MKKEQAETIALQALAFLVKDEDLLQQLLASSGLTLDDLRASYRNEDVLGGILDALLKEDGPLLAFCKESSLSPATLLEARQALPGGDVFPND